MKALALGLGGEGDSEEASWVARGSGQAPSGAELVKPRASLASLWRLILKTQIIFDIRAREGSQNFRGFFPVSSILPTHPTDPAKAGINTSLVLDPWAWPGQDRTETSAQLSVGLSTAHTSSPNCSRTFDNPAAKARPDQAVSSSVFLGKVRPCCWLPEQPKHSESFLTLADSLPFLLSSFTPLDGL